MTLAKGLDKRTIAEFVGNQDTLEYLAEHGVDYAQGFHVGRAIPLQAANAQHTADLAIAPPHPS